MPALKRLKQADYIGLDADVLFTLWKDPNLIPESWKEKVSWKTCEIVFDGSILRRSDGYRCVLCLYWLSGRWRWGVRWLVYGWDDLRPSAVLAS